MKHQRSVRKTSYLGILIAVIFQASWGLASINPGDLGGVSGGGGIVNPSPESSANLTIEETSETIEHGRARLTLFLRKKYQDWRQGAESTTPRQVVYSAIFARADQLFSAISGLPIYLEKQAPCYDRNDRPVDACIFSPVQRTVCVSAFSISKKLNRRDLNPQVRALLAHEYAEIAGFNEVQAIQFQNMVADELSSSESSQPSSQPRE